MCPHYFTKSTLCFAFCGAVAVLSALAAPESAPFGQVRLVHDTKVALRVQLTLRSPEGVLASAEETLNGLAGETLVLERTLAGGPEPLRVQLAVIAYPDERGECRLEIRSEVSRGQPVPTTSSRTVGTAAERLNLVDLWTDRADRLRLVAGLSVGWEVVPRLTTLAPDSEPIDLVFELLDASDPGRPELIERHRLGGLVGAPSRYTFKRTLDRSALEPGATGPSPAGDARLVLEALPERIEDGQVSLAVRLQYEARAPGSESPTLDLSLTDRVPPGFGVELALPRKPGEPALVFRVTPYF